MRHENQNWYSLTITLEAVAAGTGITGLAPTASLYRRGDGKWFDPASGFTAASPVLISLSAVDAVNFPGLYAYRVPTGYCLEPSSTNGQAANLPYYIATIKETKSKILEHVGITTTIPAFDSTTATYGASGGTFGLFSFVTFAGKIWDQPRASHTLTNSFGEYVNIPISDATVANAVWNEDISTQTVYTQAGTVLSKLGFETGLSETNAGDNMHVCSVQDSIGKFYGTNVPAPSADVTAAYAGRVAILHDNGTTNRNYSYVVASVATDGSGNYFQLQKEDGTAITRMFKVGYRLFVLNKKFTDTSVSSIWSEPMAGYSVAGTFGESFRRMLALRQENMKVVYTAWNAANVPTAGKVYIYPSKSALDADTGDTGVGALGSYSFTGTFDVLKPTKYSSAKLT